MFACFQLGVNPGKKSLKMLKREGRKRGGAKNEEDERHRKAIGFEWMEIFVFSDRRQR